MTIKSSDLSVHGVLNGATLMMTFDLNGYTCPADLSDGEERTVWTRNHADLGKTNRRFGRIHRMSSIPRSTGAHLSSHPRLPDKIDYMHIAIRLEEMLP